MARTRISFSVVMPAYNTEPWIGTAIESVLDQTRTDFELIVVDDGSTDDTVAAVQRYVRQDDRVSLVTQQHRGSSAARNAAIALAAGDYVSFIDSDDLWLPCYLEVMAATLEGNPHASVAHTDAWILHDDLKKIQRGTAMGSNRPPVVPDEPHDFLRALLEHSNFVYGALTVRRPVLLEVGGFREDVRSSLDYELWMRIAAHGYSFVRTPETLAIYRRRTGQITSDPAAHLRSLPAVFRSVADDYPVPDDIRAFALRLSEEWARKPTPPPTTRRSFPRVLRPLHRAIWQLKWFYVRPPAQVRAAFPDLRSL
jgi:glycosyltransferase involved in cell wall biosynthesis